VDYDAQAAIELEMLAPDDMDIAALEAYPFAVDEQNGMKVVRLRKILSAIVGDIRVNVPVPVISLKFHATVAQVVLEMCKLIAGESGINRVALSGGVFQNRLLLRLTAAALRKGGFDVLTHQLVPCNDGGISLGQAVIANFAGSSKGGVE